MSSSAVLWQSEDRKITLIDIPRSIALAQAHEKSRHLLSTSPLQSPFQSNEPKTAKARATLQKNLTETALHEEYQGLLRNAITTIRKEFDKPWCLPRHFTDRHEPSSKKRKMTSDEAVASPTASVLQDGLISAIARTRTSDIQLPVLIHPRDDEDKHIEESSIFIDRSDEPTTLSISRNNINKQSFHIPPRSSFCLGDISIAKPFRNALQTHLQPPTFDFILLDPPWPNSSVKRTHRTPGSTYSTVSSIPEIRELLLDSQLERLMAEESLVGVWITNRAAVRELVLGENGLFDCWGVEWVEEWVWLKTTVHGEPVLELDALWRKPYEILLVGRKVKSGDGAREKVQRRVVVSVPDLHSRKPCLKELIEPMIPDASSYNALEIFARHLVAGWWSWGDECIKFNWDGYWKEEESDDETNRREQTSIL